MYNQALKTHPSCLVLVLINLMAIPQLLCDKYIVYHISYNLENLTGFAVLQQI